MVGKSFNRVISCARWTRRAGPPASRFPRVVGHRVQLAQRWTFFQPLAGNFAIMCLVPHPFSIGIHFCNTRSSWIRPMAVTCGRGADYENPFGLVEIVFDRFFRTAYCGPSFGDKWLKPSSINSKLNVFLVVKVSFTYLVLNGNKRHFSRGTVFFGTYCK